jgi:Ca-activated chloride channel homolog
MKKLAVALLSIGLLSLSIFAQFPGQPRRQRPTPSPTPAATPIPSTPSTRNSETINQPTQDTETSNQNKRPPVLIGAPQSSPTPPPKSAEDVLNEDEVIRIETNLVTIPVSVLDRDGRFISGLRQSDFEIFEDGVPQKIEYFAPIEQPFTVVLLIDVSPSTAFQIDEIHNAAIAFVNQLRQNDRVTVVAFDSKVQVLSPPTNNRSVLYNAIRRANFGDGTSLYEAVDVSISQLLRQIEGRKAVVLFTDGVDTTSKRATYQSTIRRAEEADAMIYPIRYDTSADMASGGGGYPGNDPLGTILGGIFGGRVRIGGGGGYPRGGGAGSSRSEYETGRRYLEELARTTGGRAFEARSIYNLDAAFSGIAEELRRQYSIGYYPENPGQPGQRKQIRVRTNRSAAVVRAKNSYIVGATGDNSAKANPSNPPTMRTSPRRLPF